MAVNREAFSKRQVYTPESGLFKRITLKCLQQLYIVVLVASRVTSQEVAEECKWDAKVVLVLSVYYMELQLIR